MNQKFVIIFMATAVTAGVISIISKYIITPENNPSPKTISDDNQKTVEIYHPMITTAPLPSDEPEECIIYYTLQSEGDMLHLYEINGEHRKAVKSLPINPEMFPFEDRELLKSGIKANTLEEGIEIIENFIS